MSGHVEDNVAMVGGAAADTDFAYRRVADEMRSAIGPGRPYPPGARLPSESELMKHHGVSRGTIRQTYAQLQHEGIISSRRGSRRIVVDAPRLQQFERLLSFSLWGRSIGEQPSARMIRLVRRQISVDEGRELDLPPDAIVVHILRLRFLSGRPTMIERATYPEDLGRIIADMRSDTKSITETLTEHGYLFARASHTIDALSASTEDSNLLEVRRGSPLLRARRLTTDPNGRALELSDDRYRADSVVFSIANSADANNLSRHLAET
jgi:GntR family transcriptional regulator